MVEITSIESLAKIAERYERYILHSSGDAGDHFRVEDDTTLYLYRPSAPPALPGYQEAGATARRRL